jgi:hypothetical protein
MRKPPVQTPPRTVVRGVPGKETVPTGRPLTHAGVPVQQRGEKILRPTTRTK